MGAPKLFSPGPVLVEDSVRASLMHYDICHRSSEFEEMFQDTQQKILRLFEADDSYYAVIVSGSGTSANECVLTSVVNEGEKVLLIKNGVFGERLEEIIDHYSIPSVKVGCEWAEYPDVRVIEEAIKANPDVALVAMVFHETSTGMVNPVAQVGKLCKTYGKRFFVDCVSAAGGEHILVGENNIDYATSVGGKCIGAFPGSAYVIAKRELLAKLTAKQCRTVYLSLYKHFQSSIQSHQTPNTPNVTLFWALNQALTNIINKGLGQWIDDHARCAEILRAGVKEMGMEMLLREHMSNTVTTVKAPESVSVKALIADMEKRGYVLYPGKGKYESSFFQIANMGNISAEDCTQFLAVLKDCINSLRH